MANIEITGSKEEVQSLIAARTWAGSVGVDRKRIEIFEVASKAKLDEIWGDGKK